MRIGFYGLPCAGKSFILNEIKNRNIMNVIEGSITMKALFPEFDSSNEKEKQEIRIKFAKWLSSKEDFIMDGHYAFGNDVVFTEADGMLYDTFFYLYIDPKILQKRMELSEKNKKYAKFDIETWQQLEIEELRAYCHKNEKDFFIIDNPFYNSFCDTNEVIAFIEEIYNGYSCVKFAKNCVSQILEKEKLTETIILFDGDKTISLKDTSNLLYGYTTNIFDNNFYTGYQSWRHDKNYMENFVKKSRQIFLKEEQTDHFKKKEQVEHRTNNEFTCVHEQVIKADCECLFYKKDCKSKFYLCEVSDSENRVLDISFNDFVVSKIKEHSYIITSGDGAIWEQIAKYFQIGYFYGNQMSADTKYFIAKFLRQAGKKVLAYGDSMNDYYMLKEADEGYLVAKQDGSISKSLHNMDLGEITIV